MCYESFFPRVLFFLFFSLVVFFFLPIVFFLPLPLVRGWREFLMIFCAFSLTIFLPVKP